MLKISAQWKIINVSTPQDHIDVIALKDLYEMGHFAQVRIIALTTYKPMSYLYAKLFQHGSKSV